MFHNVLARQGFSIRNRARLYFQAFALSDMKMAAQESCRVGQKPGGYSIYPWVERCGTAPHTLTLFKTNIADFPTLFKTEFRFFITLFKKFNPNIN